MGSLYNQYMNKNIRFLLNYLGYAGRTDELKPYTRNGLQLRIHGYIGITSNDVSESICGEVSDDPAIRKAQRSCALLYEPEDGGPLRPALTWNGRKLPELTSSAERSWLRYVLNDPMSELFMKPKALEDLLEKLEDDGTLDRSYIDDRATAGREHERYGENFIGIFRQTVHFVKNCTSCEMLLHSGETGHFFPYAVSFSDTGRYFTVVGYDFAKEDIAFHNIEDIAYMNSAARSIPSGKAAEELFLDALERHQVKEPVVIEVMGPAANNPNMSNDRISHLLSVYESECYESDGKLMMSVHYYDFQREEIIRNILALGKYVRVVSPDDVRDEIIENLRNVVGRYT